MSNSDGWVNLLSVDSLEKDDVTEIRLEGVAYAVYDTLKGISVSHARCSHAGANLCHGYFDGKHIECPLHQGLFDAFTGLAKAAPAIRPLTMMESRIEQGYIQIKLSKARNS